MAGRVFTGRIASVEPLTEQSTVVTLTCPAGTAAGTRAGQFVSVLCRDRWSFDPYLRCSPFVFAASPGDETISIAVTNADRGDRWIAERAPESEIDLSGPTGNGFTISSTARNLLLIGSEGRYSSLVLLASTAVERRLNVTFLMGAANERELLPPYLLPSGVEVVMTTTDGSRGQAGDIRDLIPDFARWADQILVQGDEHLYRALAATLQPLRIAGKPPVQVAVDQEMPCGNGLCLGCPVSTRRGVVSCCVRGPVFDLDELL